jgi:hypothetical protein
VQRFQPSLRAHSRLVPLLRGPSLARDIQTHIPQCTRTCYQVEYGRCHDLRYQLGGRGGGIVATAAAAVAGAHCLLLVGTGGASWLVLWMDALRRGGDDTVPMGGRVASAEESGSARRCHSVGRRTRTLSAPLRTTTTGRAPSRRTATRLPFTLLRDGTLVGMHRWEERWRRVCIMSGGAAAPPQNSICWVAGFRLYHLNAAITFTVIGAPIEPPSHWCSPFLRGSFSRAFLPLPPIGV